MTFALKEIEQAIFKSQHCQRNWDLSRSIPPEDLELMITAATQCPSKQNIAFYQTHFITNRQIIEKLHEHTDGFTVTYEPYVTTTNTQVLANLLVVFEEVSVHVSKDTVAGRNDQTYELADKGENASVKAHEVLNRDVQIAVGVAAGFLNLTATLMGYATGCCSCFHEAGVQEVLELRNSPLLLMGIGFKHPTMGRRVHHLKQNFLFPTKPKQQVTVNIIS